MSSFSRDAPHRGDHRRHSLSPRFPPQCVREQRHSALLRELPLAVHPARFDAGRRMGRLQHRELLQQVRGAVEELKHRLDEARAGRARAGDRTRHEPVDTAVPVAEQRLRLPAAHAQEPRHAAAARAPRPDPAARPERDTAVRRAGLGACVDVCAAPAAPGGHQLVRERAEHTQLCDAVARPERGFGRHRHGAHGGERNGERLHALLRPAAARRRRGRGARHRLQRVHRPEEVPEGAEGQPAAADCRAGVRRR